MNLKFELKSQCLWFLDHNVQVMGHTIIKPISLGIV